MATILRKVRELEFAAVDATPLDGTTAGRTYQPTDRLKAACIRLDEETDAVIITMSGTGSEGNLCVFNIYGYGEDRENSGADGGPAEAIYNTVTATLGTAVAGTGQLYVDTVDGTDLHTSTIGIYDSENNRVCKFKFDTQGLRYLYFEPTEFSTLTKIKFIVREVGEK